MNKLILILGMLTLGACATQTTYRQADSEREYGYTDSQITENRYRVGFKGNSRTDSSEVKDMALLRAAELTLLNNYDWFRVVNQDTQLDSGSNPAVSTSIGTGQQVRRDCGLLGCTSSVSPFYTGLQVTTSRDADSYSTSIEIVMGKGDLADQTSAYDATQLRNNLKARFAN